MGLALKREENDFDNRYGQDICHIDIPFSQDSKLRATSKLVNGLPAIDLRFWGINKHGQQYPKKKGLLIPTNIVRDNLIEVLRVLSDAKS